MWAGRGPPEAIVDARGLNQVSDAGALEALIDRLIAANPGQARAVQAKPQAIGWFVGQVMRETGGKANPASVNAILRAKLGPLRPRQKVHMRRPIEIYYWPTPNGHKVTIACEEMGLPYEIKPVNIGRGDQFKPEFLAIRPNNRMPAIIDPDGPGGEPIAIFESGAILQYLGRKTGLFYPQDERARVKVDEWVFWQMANLGPNAGQRNHFRNYAPSFMHDQRQVAYGAIRYTNEVAPPLRRARQATEGRDFITGEYTIADMITWPWVAGRSSSALDIDHFPNLAAWHARIAAREAVQRALAQAEKVRSDVALTAPGAAAEAARKVLFGQRAR